MKEWADGKYVLTYYKLVPIDNETKYNILKPLESNEELDYKSPTEYWLEIAKVHPWRKSCFVRK